MASWHACLPTPGSCWTRPALFPVTKACPYQFHVSLKGGAARPPLFFQCSLSEAPPKISRSQHLELAKIHGVSTNGRSTTSIHNPKESYGDATLGSKSKLHLFSLQHLQQCLTILLAKANFFQVSGRLPL